MNNDHIISSLNKELDDLESKIEELSNKYLDLKKENQLLKDRQEKEVSEKFKKLKTFYKYGLPYEGWKKYDRIILKYEGQIVCKKKKK